MIIDLFLLKAATFIMSLLPIDPPSLLSSFSDTVKNLSSTLQLTCVFGGNPLPQIQWYMRANSTGEEQQLSNDGRITISHEVNEIGNSSELRVSDLHKSDEGIYTCMATNNVENLIGAIDNAEGFVIIYGRVNHSNACIKFTFTYLNLHAVPPSVYPSGNENLLAGVKDGNFSIAFQIENDFPSVQLSNIRWHFTNLSYVTTQIEPSEHYVFSSDLTVLELRNVQLADRGNYSLIAGNEAGVTSATVQMDVYGEYQ